MVCGVCGVWDVGQKAGIGTIKSSGQQKKKIGRLQVPVRGSGESQTDSQSTADKIR